MNVRKFDIVAINANIVYNKYGDYDPERENVCPKTIRKKSKRSNQKK